MARKQQTWVTIGKRKIELSNLDKALFPELLDADKGFRATCGLFDAEIVCLDSLGRHDRTLRLTSTAQADRRNILQGGDSSHAERRRSMTAEREPTMSLISLRLPSTSSA